MFRELFLCATLSCLYFAVYGQNGIKGTTIPRTSFTCVGRASGYYADMETDCQVYHMCDGIGRQFSYSCPNTTLFQQRMLICDHWYMVNCSMSERDYDANLLIGQRDKPFVSEAEMSQRTPRPDILSVPPNSNFFDGLRESESKYSLHSGNSIVGSIDTISSGGNEDLDSGKQNYRPPTAWSTKKPTKDPEPTRRPEPPKTPRPTRQPNFSSFDKLAGAASQPGPTFSPIEVKTTTSTIRPVQNVPPPSRELSPPIPPKNDDSEEVDIDVRIKDKEDPVVTFIKRFDPNSPDSHKTSMTKTEIINLNKQLPDAQASSEEDRTPRKNKNFDNNFNHVKTNEKGVSQGSRFDSVNTKPIQASDSSIPQPSRELVPPKTDYTEQTLTTEGPLVYYEWKWAVPALDLEPPKIGNDTNNETSTSFLKTNVKEPKNPFRDVTRPPPDPETPTAKPINTEYNISSYLVPDYVFPLDKPHPGYEDENARTSFLVQVPRPGKEGYGENPKCPQCHPAYVVPGTCEPCIVRR